VINSAGRDFHDLLEELESGLVHMDSTEAPKRRRTESKRGLMQDLDGQQGCARPPVRPLSVGSQLIDLVGFSVERRRKLTALL
jgi:hypothetical protein